MTAYYNEHDKKAAAWLRELIREGLIAPGDVDERSIEDVLPADLVGYQQCHFFAGIGGWSFALRLAGWRDDRPVWTGSCPCQPFSAAGAGKGASDGRHLWPAFWWLVAQCGPPIVFGEQVASAAGRAWLAGVRLDLETLGYRFGAADLCAAGVGAPHIRQRAYWVAHAERDGGGLGESERTGLERHSGDGDRGSEPGRLDAHAAGSTAAAGDVRRPWDGAVWIECEAGKIRRIEPGIAPLVDGPPRGMVPSGDIGLEEVENSGEARVMRLRGYGNGLTIPVAVAFIEAVNEASLQAEKS